MQIVLASNNRKKLQELQALLQPTPGPVTLTPQSAFDIPEAEESGLTFVENAILKARHASQLTGLPAIADDSGLEVDALDGAPGIYSARFAAAPGEGNSDDEANNALLLARLKDIPRAKRTARFQCAIVLQRYPNDPMPLVCQGTWEGFILEQAAGAHGFGYDPLFFVPTHHCSSAELPPAVKNAISHRGQALRQLLARWPLGLREQIRGQTTNIQHDSSER
jgi:XTP/dITP diphosphohydrolase